MQTSKSIFIDKKSDVGILMLHGFTSAPEQFGELSTFLAGKGFTVYAPLMAGHGTSPKELIKTCPEDWKKSVKDAYLKLKESAQKIFIIGNSFGSNMAFWLANEFKNEPIGIVALGAPVFMRYHKFLVFRLYTYGLIQKYYRKPVRIYRTDYTDMSDEVTYSVMPTKSLREFFNFIKQETIPNLEKINAPVFLAYSDSDPVVHPKSATFIHERIGSDFKKIYWFPSEFHVITADARRAELFNKIFDFIKKTI